MAGRRHKGGHDDHEEHMDESWLVSYADMMTLLVALFMVLFSISSVNVSKFESLQRALKEAFSGRVQPGGMSIKETGGTDNVAQSSATPPYPSLDPYTSGSKRPGEAALTRKKEREGFKNLKKRIDAIAASQGLSGKVQTRIGKDGLTIRLLTDDLLFESGQATPREESYELLGRIGKSLAAEGHHAVVVEGHTDPVPIRSAAFPTNWELSTARAAGVVRAFDAVGVSGGRMTASGRAYTEPVADNDSVAGRALNRRVEILLPAIAPPLPEAAPAGAATLEPDVIPSTSTDQHR